MASLPRGLMAVVVLAAVALPSFGATPSEFYLGMYQKGLSAYEAGRFDAATSPLRISAFGFVDSVEHYQMAHVYLALAHDRLGDAQQAAQSARRVVAAERIEQRYAALELPAETRSAFAALARKLLTPADVAALERTPVPTKPQLVAPRTTPSQTTTAPATAAQVPAATATAKPKPEAPQAPPVTGDSARPKPAPATVERQPPQTQPAPQKTAAETKQPTQPKVSTDPPAAAKPAPATMSPAPATALPPKATPSKPAQAPATAPSQTNMAARFKAAEQALAAARLAEARTIYRELLDLPSLDRTGLLRLAEGLYRSRDFGPTLRAFNRLGSLRRGEEPYRYYIAVALYETGQYARSKQELTAALPYIEITPDVARYKSKIEGAVN